MAYVIGDDCIACGTCQGECPAVIKKNIPRLSARDFFV